MTIVDSKKSLSSEFGNKPFFSLTKGQVKLRLNTLAAIYKGKKMS